VWAQIFGDGTLDLSRIEVVGDVLHDRCRYKIDTTPPEPKQIVFFRLASSSRSSLQLVKKIAEIGSLSLGDRITKHGATGHVHLPDGEEWEYLVTEFIENSMTMEAVWEQILPENREQLIREIREAVICLRRMSRDD
jgi:hypothetical protein